MSNTLVVLLTVVVVWLLLLSAGVAASIWALRRSNRVVPGEPTAAPVLWLWSPSRPARLHRRLRTLAAWVSTAPPSTHREAWDRLLAEAVSLDREAAIAARAPHRVRGDGLRDLARQVHQLERLAARLRKLDGPATTAPAGSGHEPTGGLVELQQHVESLESAHGELDALERALRGEPQQP